LILTHRIRCARCWEAFATSAQEGKADQYVGLPKARGIPCAAAAPLAAPSGPSNQ